jgi:hypothetical protein
MEDKQKKMTTNEALEIIKNRITEKGVSMSPDADLWATAETYALRVNSGQGETKHSTMTKKDYIQLAKDLNARWKKTTPEQGIGFALAVECIKDVLKRDNPNFNRETFHYEVFK